MEKKKKYVIFDMDGVLLNSEPLHLSAKLDILASYGIVGIECAQYAGVGNVEFWTSMKERFGLEDKSVEELLDMQYAHILSHVISDNVGTIDGARELLQALKDNGFEMALASASHGQLVYPVLEVLGIRDYFKVVVTGSDNVRSKPSSDIYNLAIARMGIDPAEAYAIEDTTNGITSANGAGLTTIGFVNPMSGPQSHGHAAYVVEKLSDIENIIIKPNK